MPNWYCCSNEQHKQAFNENYRLNKFSNVCRGKFKRRLKSDEYISTMSDFHRLNKNSYWLAYKPANSLTKYNNKKKKKNHTQLKAFL